MNNFNGPQPMFGQQMQPYGAMQDSQFQRMQNQAMMWGQNQQRYSMPSMLPGRQISSIEEIMPNDVPMDGSVSFFPVRDGSCVYAKYWNRQGTIDTIKFVPEMNVVANIEETSGEENPFQEILRRLDKIEKSLVSGRKSPSSTSQSPKKEDKTNE